MRRDGKWEKAKYAHILYIVMWLEVIIVVVVVCCLTPNIFVVAALFQEVADIFFSFIVGGSDTKALGHRVERTSNVTAHGASTADVDGCVLFGDEFPDGACVGKQLVLDVLYWRWRDLTGEGNKES